MNRMKFLIIWSILLVFLISPVNAVILPSDDPSYTLVATGGNYTAYFSPMNTNGFKFIINDHSFSFLPRSISYTDSSGLTSLHLGSAQDTQIQNTSGMVYFDNAYGLGGQLQYLSNPLMIKEVYVLNELPLPPDNENWMTLSSIAFFDDDLNLKYIDENGAEKSWDGTKTKTNEITFYDASDRFQFELPQPLAKDALNNTISGHYLINEKDGILYISARFPYASLANMTLPIYLDISLAEGKVDFSDKTYFVDDYLEIWARGFFSSNERVQLFDPNDQVVKTFDWPSYADGWTSKYTYKADQEGTWKAELQTKSWLWGNWKVLDTAHTKVSPKSTPTPTPTPTPASTNTPTPVPTTTPGPVGLLHGIIYDTSGNDVDGANIKVDTGQSYNFHGDNDYMMMVPSGTRAVTVTASGYLSQTKSIEIVAGIFNQLNFNLEPVIPPTPIPTPTPTYAGSISINKDEYYLGDTNEANAINMEPSLEYRIKWYKDSVLIESFSISGVSDYRTIKQVSGDNSAIGAEYKVELTNPDGTFLKSDTAKVVVRPRDVKIAVILAEPSDDSHNASHDKNYYLTQIVPDLIKYYDEISYGAVNIIINSNDVYDNNGKWYKLGKTAAYYGKNVTKTYANGTTYEDGSDNSSQFRFDAVDAADNDINFNNYDAVIVIHSGKSQQERGGNWDSMRTHAWMGNKKTKSGEVAKNLILDSESELMGTWAHEVGHALGRILLPNKPPYYLPDLYGNKTVGSWGLMGSGNWNGNPRGSNPVHMSSFSKDWLGWLTNKSIDRGTYWVNSLVTMDYGDSTTQYILKDKPKIKFISYYLIETRTNNPAYSKWDTSAPIPYGYNNALVLYQIELADKNYAVNYIANLIPWKGVPYEDHSSYWDFASKIRFTSLEERVRSDGTKSLFEMKVGIEDFSIPWLVGAILEPKDNLFGYVSPYIVSSSLNSKIPLPDIDLHAYTLDGKHVGVNYTTGVYENEIPGANASGDLLNGREWIFIPDNIEVQFVVDSIDNQIFLNSYPELQQITNDTQSYNLSIVYDTPNDVRYTAYVDQSIQPEEVIKYHYSIVKNIDGTYNVILDDTPPVIFNTTPKNVTTNPQISAEFTDNEGGSGIDSGSISLIIDDIDMTSKATIMDSSISMTPLLNDGMHEIILNVSDNAGNKAIANWNFTLDTTPPEITISNIFTLTNQTVVPDIKVTDTRDANPLIELSLDGAAYNDLPITTEGKHMLTVTASDDVGNTAIHSISFTIDRTPPSISITGAENNGFYNISKTISYSVTDNIDAVPLISANYESGTVFSDDNEYSVQMVARDQTGNTATKILNFTIDKTPPVVNITSPTNNSYVGGMVKIKGAATDSNMKKISLEIDGISKTNTTDYLWDSIKVTDGGHEIRLNAEDKAGNTASTSIIVRVDNTPPDIINITPIDNTVVNSTYSISADYNDTSSGIDVNSFLMLIDGIDETKNALITNTSIQYKPDMQDGKHTVKLSVNDMVGNRRTVTISFELDTTPPDVKINFPANNSFVRQTIAVSGSANDIHLGAISLEIDAIKVSSTSTYTWDTTLVKDGIHEIKLNAIDMVKNSASVSINAIVDNTPPVIQLYPANGTEFYSDQNLRIEYNVTDATSGVASSSVTLDGIVVSKGDIIDLRNLSIGGHVIRVIARDNAGNGAESSTTFIVKPLQAFVEFEPHTLNINSSGRWIQAEIEISGYSAKLIDVSSIRLNGTIPVEVKSNEIEEDGKDDVSYDDDLKLKVKFNRTQVQNTVSLGNVTLYISGKVNGAAFTGNSTIRVIKNQKIDLDKENEESEKRNINKRGKS